METMIKVIISKPQYHAAFLIFLIFFLFLIFTEYNLHLEHSRRTRNIPNLFSEHDLRLPREDNSLMMLEGQQRDQIADEGNDGPVVDNKDDVNAYYFSMLVTEEDIEDFSVKLPDTLPNFKNPCWIEMVPEDFSYTNVTLYYQLFCLYPENQPHGSWQDSYDYMENLIHARKRYAVGSKAWRIRCFPYFFLLGFTKCGTSDLRRTLSFFPDFVDGITKEPKFWNKIRLRSYHGADMLPRPTLSDYLDLYDMAAEKIRSYVFVTEEGDTYHPAIIGDFDPMTVWKIPMWRKIKGNENRDAPKYLTPHHLHSINPNIKFMILLRNPVERTFSHYKFFHSKNNRKVQAEMFHDDIKKTMQTLEKCFRDNAIRTCLYQPWKSNITTIRSVTGSVYYVYLEDWLEVFPRKQFLFIRSEDYFQNRTAVLVEILRFLEIDSPIPKYLWRNLATLPVINRSITSKMSNKTRILLQEFFAPMNRRLVSLLEDDRWRWHF
ncbi:hypothetical protein LSH36_611g04012 [Paralvinella palmiformis]|uniref:Sulfotransferase domain-containing protein n=1 Tax=Paralvinella palmiformis TaxID=53620 RepID=A0AAD9MW82_9ANNE|nr:hypothetical protein LSH36_611g04012 [Paralvinella palmiformis]